MARYILSRYRVETERPFELPDGETVVGVQLSSDIGENFQDLYNVFTVRRLDK